MQTRRGEGEGQYCSQWRSSILERAGEKTSYATLPTSGEGAATIWLTGVDTLCPVDAGSYGALVAGARVSWPSP